SLRRSSPVMDQHRRRSDFSQRGAAVYLDQPARRLPHIYLYSLDGGAPKQLTHGPWEVTAIAGVHEASGRVYSQSSEPSPLERQLYSVRLDGAEKRRLSSGAGTHRISMAPECAYYLDTFSNLTSPPEIGRAHV